MSGSLHAAEGFRLMRKGLVKEARREFELGLKVDSKDAACHLGMARIFLASDDAPAGRAALVRALELQPRNAEALAHLSRMDAEAGDDAALDRLKALAGDRDATFAIHYELGAALAQRGDARGARAALQRALELEPKSPFARVDLALALMKMGEPRSAAEHLREAIASMPREGFPRRLMARALSAAGDLQGALHAISGAVDLQPDNAELHRDALDLCLRARVYGGAIRTALELRRLEPKSARPVYFHGLSLLLAGKLPEGKQVLEEALARDGSSWEVKQALARALTLLHQDAPRARRLLEEAVAGAPGEPGPANDLAVIYLAAGKEAARAREVLAPVLAKNADEPAANLNMALALKATRGDPSAVRAHATRAMRSPDPAVRGQAERLSVT